MWGGAYRSPPAKILGSLNVKEFELAFSYFDFVNKGMNWD